MSELDLNGKKLPYIFIETRHIAYQIFDKDGYESIGHFYFRYYMDKRYHVYVIPLTNVGIASDGRLVSASVGYTVEDVVMAADGNLEKQKKINDCIANLQGEFADNTFMSRSWQADLYADGRESFITSANEARAKKHGFSAIPASAFPLSPTLYTDLTKDEITALAAMAREPKSK